MVEYNFTEKTKRLMFSSIKDSEKEKRMFGFNLCRDGDNIISGSFVEGGKDYIRMSNSSCPRSTKKIGSFYTQLFKSPLPSGSSILNQMISENKLLCIGTSDRFGRNEPISKDVNCFEIKDANKEELSEIRKIVSKNIPALDEMKFMKQFISAKFTIKE